MLDQALSAWLTTCSPARADRQVIALDDKTVRGARRDNGRAVHLFAALDQLTGAVLGQTAVDAKTNKINAFAPLLDRLNSTGAITTADAHRRRPPPTHCTPSAPTPATCPGAARTTSSSPRATSPACTDSWPPCAGNRSHPPTPRPARATGESRPETVKLVAVPAGIGFPHAALAIQITRTR